MSRAFVKEDVDIPERANRSRSASGLPPGAVNYLTARGAQRLKEKAVRLRAAGETAAAAEVERILRSATIVETPQPAPESVTFGATVTVRAADGAAATYQIVGVDEVGLDDHSVSWVSPLGRALLGANCGEKVSLGDGRSAATVLKIEHR